MTRQAVVAEALIKESMSLRGAIVAVRGTPELHAALAAECSYHRRGVYFGPQSDGLGSNRLPVWAVKLTPDGPDADAHTRML